MAPWLKWEELQPFDERMQLMLVRAEALDVFSRLEARLTTLFAQLLGIDAHKASIVFTNIGMVEGRLKLLAILLKRSYADRFNKFWKSMDRHIRDLNNTRNQVVHWRAVNSATYDGIERIQTYHLEHPQDWHIDDPTPLTIKEIYSFVLKCDVILRAIGIFTDIIAQPDYINENEYFIANEAFKYPPPEGHLIQMRYPDPTRSVPDTET